MSFHISNWPIDYFNQWAEKEGGFTIFL